MVRNERFGSQRELILNICSVLSLLISWFNRKNAQEDIRQSFDITEKGQKSRRNL